MVDSKYLRQHALRHDCRILRRARIFDALLYRCVILQRNKYVHAQRKFIRTASPFTPNFYRAFVEKFYRVCRVVEFLKFLLALVSRRRASPDIVPCICVEKMLSKISFLVQRNLFRQRRYPFAVRVYSARSLIRQRDYLIYPQKYLVDVARITLLRVSEHRRRNFAIVRLFLHVVACQVALLELVIVPARKIDLTDRKQSLMRITRRLVIFYRQIAQVQIRFP